MLKRIFTMAVLSVFLLAAACGNAPLAGHDAEGSGHDTGAATRDAGSPVSDADASDDAAPTPDASSDGPVDLPTLPPPDPCTEVDVDNPTRFPVCGAGAGNFGRWFVDAFGLPAYEYIVDEEHDARAAYPNTLGDDRRQHWHQLGNDRVVAAAFNDGYIQLLGQERGPTWYNRFAPEQKNYAGGFGFLADGDEVWATAYRYRPAKATTRRVFGLGYVENVTEHNGLRVTRRTYAPPGDATLLLTDVVLENLTTTDRPVRHYEYWDVNRHQLVFELIRSGSDALGGDAQRDAYNGYFAQSVGYDAATQTVRATMALTAPEAALPKDAVSPVDYYPADVFLTTLVGTNAEVYSDQDLFFGAGDPTRPDAVAVARPGELLPAQAGSGQPACLVARNDVTVAASASAGAPGEPVRLRFAFGYARPEAPADVDVPAAWRDVATDTLGLTLADWRTRLTYFSSETDPVVHRETAWRSYYLQSGQGYADYFASHVTPQGSAYLYSHGFDGAPRDLALFSMPLTYLQPARARELLSFIMKLQKSTDGAISYAYHGYGVLEDVLIHAHPSDLDIYLFMAMSEYLSATGDRAFLDEHVTFYPQGAAPPASVSDDTVLDHLRAAARHLFDVVGSGSHGLVKVGDGDWNDGIALAGGFDGLQNTIKDGESHANTAMAALVLPLAADILEPADAALANELRTRGQGFLAALRAEWTGRWYPRAYLRDAQDQPVLLGGDPDKLWLESQPWALLANAPDATQRTTLEDQIDTRLDSPSPIGSMIQEPVSGNEENAQVWPAVNGILTWAYARSRPDLAWRAVLRNSNAAHADAYPDIWYGIWSGPDGLNGASSTQAGYSWFSQATPMIDFPVMNRNPDAMGLLGLLRVAGIEPVSDGLRIRPVVPGARFALQTGLVALKVGPGQIAGEYHAANAGTITLHVALPAGAQPTQTLVRGQPVAPVLTPGEAAVTLTFSAGNSVAFEVDY